MGLIRFLFFVLILYVLWLMARNWLRQQEMRDAARKDKAKLANAKIVRCKQCEIHLPEQEAIREGDDWFCTPAHKQAWQARHKL
ncbi:MAG: hypothetical protein RLZZ227_2217 [Pseudomonadota bacterium]|jgi:uncharacterized protein